MNMNNHESGRTNDRIRLSINGETYEFTYICLDVTDLDAEYDRLEAKTVEFDGRNTSILPRIRPLKFRSRNNAKEVTNGF